jgi:hypothetical protein
VPNNRVFIKRVAHNLLASSDDLSSREEHRIDVVEVQLLKLRILELLYVWVLSFIIEVNLAL